MIYRLFIQSVFREKSYSLLLFFSICLGVTAITTAYHYKENLHSVIRQESVRMMGADLAVESSYLLTDKLDYIRQQLPQHSEIALLTQFSSMLYNHKTDDVSLGNVKAVTGNFPVAGRLVTEPEYRGLTRGTALLDKDLANNLQLKPGDPVMIGRKKLVMKGYILSEPVGAGSFMAFAPTVIMHNDDLAATGLVKTGSRIKYYAMIRLPVTEKSAIFKEKKFKEFISQDLTIYDSSEFFSGGQKMNFATTRYLGLLALFSYFLAVISIFVTGRYRVAAKKEEMAVLKCLGMSNGLLAKLLVIEILLISLSGSFAGNVAGYYLYTFLPQINAISTSDIFHWSVFLKSLFPGIIVPLAITIETVWIMVRLKPVAAMRNDFQDIRDDTSFSGIHTMFIPAMMLVVFYVLISNEVDDFAGAMVISLVFIILPALLFGFYMLVKRMITSIRFPDKFPSLVKLAVTRIKRPVRSVYFMIIGIGSASFIIFLSLIMRESILELSGTGYGERPNMFVMGIARENVPYFREKTAMYKAEGLNLAPVVAARLVKINHLPVQKTEIDVSAMKRDWRTTARTREYFLSYRTNLYDTEKILQGSFQDENAIDEISIEDEFMSYLGVRLGDTLTFNIQGLEVTGKVTNSRMVNWSDMKPNFVVLFSRGILEKAPSYYISSFRIARESERYKFQKEIVKKIPDITVINMTKAIESYNSIIDKISTIINLMSVLIILTGIMLLTGSFLTQKGERDREIRLLKISGASPSYISALFMIEGVLTTAIAVLVAMSAGLLTAWLLNYYVLKIHTFVPWLPVLTITVLLVLSAGLLYLVDTWNSAVTRLKLR